MKKEKRKPENEKYQMKMKNEHRKLKNGKQKNMRILSKLFNISFLEKLMKF